MKLALFARLEAKPGKEKEVAEFLQQGLALANQEATTLSGSPCVSDPPRSPSSIRSATRPGGSVTSAGRLRRR